MGQQGAGMQVNHRFWASGLTQRAYHQFFTIFFKILCAGESASQAATWQQAYQMALTEADQSDTGMLLLLPALSNHAMRCQTWQEQGLQFSPSMSSRSRDICTVGEGRTATRSQRDRSSLPERRVCRLRCWNQVRRRLRACMVHMLSAMTSVMMRVACRPAEVSELPWAWSTQVTCTESLQAHSHQQYLRGKLMLHTHRNKYVSYHEF